MIELLDTPAPETQKSYHKVVRAMNRLHAEEVFGTPEMSKGFLDSLSFEDFSRWTDMLNGISRSIPVNKRGMKGEGAIREGNDFIGYGARYRPPIPEDRVPLMKMALERAQQLDDPKLAALVLGFSVNAIHPYSDGNGRTGRVMYSLLSHGYDGSEEDKKYYSALLENTTGRQTVNPDPSVKYIDYHLACRAREALVQERGIEAAVPYYVFDGYNGAALNKQEPADLDVAEDISDDARQKLHEVMTDNYFEATSFLKGFPYEELAPYIRSVDEGKRVFIDGNGLIPTLTEEQIDSLYEASIEQKRKYVESLINLSENDLKDVWEIYNPEDKYSS